MDSKQVFRLVRSSIASSTRLLAVLIAVACSEPGGSHSETIGFTEDALTVEGCVPIDGVTYCGIDVGFAPPPFGTPSPYGTSSYDAGVFTLTGRGDGVDTPLLDADPQNDPDHMRFVYRELTGDVEVRAKLSSFSGQEGAHAGVMIREVTTGSFPTGGRNAGYLQRAAGLLSLYDYHQTTGGVGLDPNNGVKMAWRTTGPTLVSGQSATGAEVGPAAPGGAPGAPIWLRLQRWGNDVAMARSTDGQNWIPIGMPSGGVFRTSSSVMVGIFVSNGDINNQLQTPPAAATFLSVYIGRPKLDYQTSWIGASDTRDSVGFAIPHMNSLYTEPNGVSYALARETEFGSLTVIDTSGVAKQIGIAPGGGEQGAITGDGQLLFMAGAQRTCVPRIVNGNTFPCFSEDYRECRYRDGVVQPRVRTCNPGSSTTCRSCNFVQVTRKSDLAIVTRLAADATSQTWGDGLFTNVFSEPLGAIAGVAAGQGRLYVSDLRDDGDSDDRIRFVSTNPTFSHTTSVSFERPGPGAVDAQGRLWVIRGAVDYPILDKFTLTRTPLVKCYTATGSACVNGATALEIRNKTSDPTNGIVNPSAIAAHPGSSGLFVAENGPDQNVRIYSTSTATLSGTFGNNAVGTPGRAWDSLAGSARFYSPVGLGVDASGSLYVASSTNVDVRKFATPLAPQGGESVWRRSAGGGPPQLHGVHSTGSQFALDELSDGKRAYASKELYSFDTLLGQDRRWGLFGITWDPIADAQRGQPSRRDGVPLVRAVNGQRFLYVLSEPEVGRFNVRSGGVQWLSVYRFVGDVARPYMTLSFDSICALDGSGQAARDACRDAPLPPSPSACLCDVDENNDGITGEMMLSKLWIDAGGDAGDGVVQGQADNPATGVDEACTGGGEITCTVDPLNPALPGFTENSGERPPYGTCPVSGGPAECTNPPPPRHVSGFTVRPNGDLWLAFGSRGSFGNQKAIWELRNITSSGAPQYNLGSGRILHDVPTELGAADDVRFDGAGTATRMFLFKRGSSDALPKIRRYDNPSSGSWASLTPAMSLNLPQGNDVDFLWPFTTTTHGYYYFQSFDLAGDKLFAKEFLGPIRVYDANSGAPVTRLIVGPEASGAEAVSATQGVRAFRRSNGEYLVSSDNAGAIRGRVLVYNWAPPTTGQPALAQTISLAAGSRPRGITAGPDGNLWVALVGTHKIARVNPSNGTVTYSATLPTVGGVAASPMSIVAGPDGNLWFTEYGTDRIGCASPGTLAIQHRTLPSGSRPRSITVGSDGNLWFTEFSANKIGRLISPGTCAGAPTAQLTEFMIPTTGSRPWGIASSGSGMLWFTEEIGNRLGSSTLFGTIFESAPFSGPSGPSMIAGHPDGSVWSVETATTKVGKTDPATGSTTLFSVGPLTDLTGLAVDIGGYVWVGGRSHVARLDPTSGAILSTVSVGTGAFVFAITSGPNGDLWASGEMLDQLYRITR